MRGKRGKYYFSPFWFLIQKLDHNSGLHAKNQKEISKDVVRIPPPPLPFVWKCGQFPFKAKENIVIIHISIKTKKKDRQPKKEERKKWKEKCIKMNRMKGLKDRRLL